MRGLAVLFALSAATHLAGKCGAVFAEPFYLGANKHEKPRRSGVGYVVEHGMQVNYRS